MSHATVSAGLTLALIEFATSRGADRMRLMACADLDAAALADPDDRVPLARYIALMRAGKTLCSDPALALEFGAAGDYRRVSIVGLIAYASATMAEALAQINRYGRLAMEVDGVADGSRFEIVHEDGARWMIDRRANPDVFPELTEATWSRFICTTRRDFPQAVYALAAQVTHAAPPYRGVYERLWQVPIAFSAGRNAIQTTLDWGEVRIQHDNRYAFGIFSERADALLRELESQKTLRGRVENLLLARLHTGDVSIETIAGKLETTRQTLHRNLRAEGVTFEHVLDDLRRRMALDYIAAGRASVNEIAYLVGFSDASAFSRAFKRWTGQSPREARKCASAQARPLQDSDADAGV
jgi:AraC-like DNA-binding protein